MPQWTEEDVIAELRDMIDEMRGMRKPPGRHDMQQFDRVEMLKFLINVLHHRINGEYLGPDHLQL